MRVVLIFSFNPIKKTNFPKSQTNCINNAWNVSFSFPTYRNVILKMSILAVLCYYWMNVVAKTFSVCLGRMNLSLPFSNTPILVSLYKPSFTHLMCFLQCWESMVGQALYRLVIVDFLFLMLGSFFGEFLSKWVTWFQFIYNFLLHNYKNV